MTDSEKPLNKNTSTQTSETTEENTAAENKHNRRLRDGVKNKNSARKLNLDRRTVNSERRVNDDHNYKGPSRRYTIDRRLNTKDRRKPD